MSEKTMTDTQCNICGGVVGGDDPACYHCKVRDRNIRNGLRWARLQLLPSADPRRSSLPLAMLGNLEITHYHRGYWVVNGLVPLATAELLYADPVGRDIIRVAGHWCSPPPSKWLTWKLPDGRKVAKRTINGEDQEEVFDRFIAKGFLKKEQKDEVVFSDDPASTGASPFVNGYHIDGDLGLRVFVDIVRSAEGSHV